jgi:hypothetical protein
VKKYRRRYLNLDDAGHAYEYCGISDDLENDRAAGVHDHSGGCRM